MPGVKVFRCNGGQQRLLLFVRVSRDGEFGFKHSFKLPNFKSIESVLYSMGIHEGHFVSFWGRVWLVMVLLMNIVDN